MQKLRFIHCADIHLDAPFRDHGTQKYAEIRRQDIKTAFLNILNKAKETQADFLIISGDLYEHDYVTKKTMDWLNMVLTEAETPVFIIPGNHDPYIRNSWYKVWDWPENVHILSPERPHVILEELKLSVYGIGFSAFKEGKPDLSRINPPEEGYFNILIFHGTLDMDFTEQDYKPVSSDELKALNYDYYALGHFHTIRNVDNIVYPGSPEPLGFDEPGEHGAFLVTMTLENGQVQNNSQFFKTSQRQYHQKYLDITEAGSLQEVKMRILEAVEGLDKQRDLVRLTLKGRTELALDPEEISDMFSDWLYFKIRNETRKAFDLDLIEKSPTLKGAFVREIRERLKSIEKEIKNHPENMLLKEEAEKLEMALIFGLEALETRKIEWWGE